MNIDRINATLAKALVYIQEGEAQSLREFFLSGSDAGDDGELSPVEEAIDIVVTKLMETVEIDEEGAIQAVAEVLGEAVAKNFSGKSDLAEDDIVSWLGQQDGIVEAVVEHLQAA